MNPINLNSKYSTRSRAIDPIVLVSVPSSIGANLEVSKAYLYLLFLDRSFRERLRGMVTGTSKSHQRVSPQNVLDAEIVLPPENSAILQVFEGLVNPLLSRVAHNRQESRTLAGLRDSLLPKLMTEEIRLKSADTPLGAA